MQKILKNFINIIIGFILSLSFTLYISLKFSLFVSKNKDRINQKYKTYYSMMINWLNILEDGYSLNDYLIQKGIRCVAVYGGKEIGQHVLRQLNGKDVVVKYFIDKADNLSDKIVLDIYKPCKKLPKVDAVIVTPVWDFQNIKEELTKYIDYPVISLKDAIEEIKIG